MRINTAIIITGMVMLVQGMDHAIVLADNAKDVDRKPNILFILGDDIGFGNSAFTYDFVAENEEKSDIKKKNLRKNVKITDGDDQQNEDNAISSDSVNGLSENRKKNIEEEDDYHELLISNIDKIRKIKNNANVVKKTASLHYDQEHQPLMFDDSGDEGFDHDRPSFLAQITTRTLSWLARRGRVMTRHYVHNTCSPSRAAFQSGRLPIHVQLTLEQPCSPNSGVPRNMTGIAEIMKQGGYKTYFIGKWDAGMMTPRQLPIGRGYDSSLNFFSHGSENFWYGSYVNQTKVPDCNIADGCPRDFWDTDAPAYRLAGTKYEEQLLADRVMAILEETADDSRPFFITYCPRVAHYPLEAPMLYQQELLRFAAEPHRRVYAAMMMFLDEKIRQMVNIIIRTKRWDNTLIIFSSDNGGVVRTVSRCYEVFLRGFACPNGEAGGSNHPLRGGKYTNFEGGIRAGTFISGGFIPPELRGVPYNDMFHIADWYATFAHIVKADPYDKFAEKSGLPPIDSIDMWDSLINGKESLETTLPYKISKYSGKSKTSNKREVILYARNVILVNEMKLLVGTQFGATWGGIQYPNITSYRKNGDVFSATIKCQPACLFNVTKDPREEHDLAAQYPDLVVQLRATMDEYSKSIWERLPSIPDPACIKAAREKYGGFLGPWKELPIIRKTVSDRFEEESVNIIVSQTA